MARKGRLVREGLTAPLYPNAEAVPAQGEARETRMATARHRIRYHKGTRLKPRPWRLILSRWRESFAPSPSHPA